MSIPRAIRDVGETVRALEQATGKASCIVAYCGGDAYLVGDLERRAGQYTLQFLDSLEDTHEGLPARTVDLSHLQQHEGSYAPFAALQQVVDGLSVMALRDGRQRKLSLHIGGGLNGLSVDIKSYSLGDSQFYTPIGHIGVPLLQQEEQVVVRKLRE